MNRLTEVLKRFVEDTEKVLPVSRLQKYKLQNWMSDLADGSSMVKPSQALQGILEDKALFAKLDEAKSQQEVLELLVAHLEKLVTAFEKKPSDTDIDVGFFKSLCARFGKNRHETEREDEEEGKEDEGKDAEKDLEKAVKSAAKDGELDTATVDGKKGKTDAVPDAEDKSKITPTKK